MAAHLTRLVLAASLSISAIALAQCSRSEPLSPASPGSIAATSTDAVGPTGSSAVVVGQFKVCKAGNVSGSFSIVIVSENPAGSTTLVGSTVTIAPGECQVVAENLSGQDLGATVRVTETSAGLQSITNNANGTNVALGPVSGFINFIHGVSYTFTNRVEVPPDVPPGDEGCTPGYWRNHTSSWVGTGYAPGDDFDATFGVNFFNPNITLLQAVNLGGGGINVLVRHGVAGLLSAASPDVDYAYTVAQVIDIVQGDGAYAGLSVSARAALLVAANEAGCPIN